MAKKNSNAVKSVTPPGKKKTLEAFFRYYELSSLLFDEGKDEIFNVTDIPEKNKFRSIAAKKATDMGISWNNMSHEDSNRIMLAMLEDSFNLMKKVEDSKNIIIHAKVEVV